MVKESAQGSGNHCRPPMVRHTRYSNALVGIFGTSETGTCNRHLGCDLSRGIVAGPIIAVKDMGFDPLLGPLPPLVLSCLCLCLCPCLLFCPWEWKKMRQGRMVPNLCACDALSRAHWSSAACLSNRASLPESEDDDGPELAIVRRAIQCSILCSPSLWAHHKAS